MLSSTSRVSRRCCREIDPPDIRITLPPRIWMESRRSTWRTDFGNSRILWRGFNQLTVSSKPSKRYLRRITAAAWIVSVWLCRALMDRYNRHQRIIIHLITEVVQYRVLLIPLWIKPSFLAIEMHVTRVFNWMRMYIRKKNPTIFFETFLLHCTGCFKNRWKCTFSDSQNEDEWWRYWDT